MLFNSFDFAVFLPVVYLLYWFVFNRNIALRNVFLLVASYTFYGFWDWRFIPLIVVSSATDFFIGQLLQKITDAKKRKILFIISIFVNLSILGFFKYYNFFVGSFVDAFSLFGMSFNYSPLNIILPVGISFYTFQSMGYIFDIYKRKTVPTSKIIDFCAFVSFFPQLVAGPIERASHLLPQFSKIMKFDYHETRSGLLMITFGLFKKIVIADRLAVFVDAVYGNAATACASVITVAAVFFAFQLYFDFSAYSDIAIGTARILGFKLSANFRRPYLSASFAEFWARWHISLSSWFRDYVYIPLGGNRRGSRRTIINVAIVFALSGLWHGASWNFFFWGLMNAFFMICIDRWLSLQRSEGLKRALSPVLVFACWALSLVFFRVPGLADAVAVFKSIGWTGAESFYDYGLLAAEFKFAVYLLVGMTVYEIATERNSERLQKLFYSRNFAFVRFSVYLILIFAIVYLGSYGAANDNSFIYFQF